MGATTCDAIIDADGMELVAAVDPGAAGGSVHGVEIAPGVDACIDARCTVVVDFSVAAAARVNVPRLAGAGIHVVVGTTGLDDDDLRAFEAAATASGAGHVLVVSNFAISAVLMMRLSELAAPFFDTVEIIELHHAAKADAPSGTALTTARRIAASSSEWAADSTINEKVVGARGGIGPAGIRMHSVRMQGMVAHQEVILGTAGQTLTIRQDSYDRDSFMPGVLRAVRGVDDLLAFTQDLDVLLGI